VGNGETSGESRVNLVMPLEWRTRRLTFCGGALVAMLFAVPALAQPPFDYDRLVDAYATGHLDEAVSQLSRWPWEQVKGAVGSFVKAIEAQTALVTAPVSSRRLRAAAMLHTDLAAALLNDDFTRAESHINLARRLVDLLAGRRRRDPRAREFVQRWYEFAPSIYLAHPIPDKALLLVREGFTHAPDNATLHLYSGIVFEMIGPQEAALVARSRLLTLRPGRMEAPLEAAARAYGLALKADSHMAVARIHLGRVHFLQRDSRARADLERALADATDVGTRYLAYVFLGDLAESDKRPADALREYEAAMTVGPRYQTAYVAAARMADALGEFERAREIALALVGIEKREDPWWNYRLGELNMPALQWLRTAAQEP
jgi:tetratricopeptide (TPR) repeat protein